MTAKSISAILQLIAHLLIFIWQYILQLRLTGTALAFETQSYLWGAFFIRTLLITVATQIAISIIFHIIVRIKTRDRIDQQDERDTLIELRSLRNFTIVFAIGFFSAMLLLTLNFPIDRMFQALAFGYLLSGLTLNITQIIYYEKGYEL